MGAGHMHLRIQGQRHRRQFGRRVQVRETSSEGATVAGLTVADMAEGLAHERAAPGDQLRPLEASLAGHGTNVNGVASLTQALEIGDTIEIHQHFGRQHAHRHHRHQRLTASQGPRIFVLGQQRQGFVAR